MEILTAAHAHLCLKHLVDLEVEEFWALALGPRQTLLARRMLFRGTVDRCPIHPRDVFRFACRENASSILIAHNHPTGDPTPSEEDLAITERLRFAGKLLEIPLTDHLIIASAGYTSLASLRWPRPRRHLRVPLQGRRRQTGAKSGERISTSGAGPTLWGDLDDS